PGSRGGPGAAQPRPPPPAAAPWPSGTASGPPPYLARARRRRSPTSTSSSPAASSSAPTRSHRIDGDRSGAGPACPPTVPGAGAAMLVGAGGPTGPGPAAGMPDREPAAPRPAPPGARPAGGGVEGRGRGGAVAVAGRQRAGAAQLDQAVAARVRRQHQRPAGVDQALQGEPLAVGLQPPLVELVDLLVTDARAEVAL